MSSGWRVMPILLLVSLVVTLAWRLVQPDDPAIRSQMVERHVPDLQLAPALPTKSGLNSAQLADGQPRLLNIFASWCVPCAAEAPVLNELRRKGAKIDAIAVRDTPGAIAAFLGRNGDPYQRIGADLNSNAQIALGSSGVPETFVIDGRGIIRYQYVGPLTQANVRGVLKQLEDAR
jgi:cytochrome c biogenesis protein CcmG, thiol:disulfide interchange protein DsbE